MLTQARLRELLDYDPATGVFIWRVAGGRRKVGAQAGYIHKAITSTVTYRRIEIDGVAVFAHRLAFLWMTGEFPPDGMQVDHKNRDGLDNRWGNLRLATDSQNRQNHKRRRDNQSGYMGVYPHNVNGTYCAVVRDHGKLRYLGSFKTAAEAAMVRDEAAGRLYGEFVTLNFPS